MKKKVLIIDDDLQVCKEIKYAMQNETTDAYYAISAKDAFEKLNKMPFCLVIMDTHLSETDGIDLLRTIRGLKTIPVLVLSSKVASADKVAALRAGASSYINKPYELEECLAHAQSLMQLYSDLHPPQSRSYTLAFGIDLVIDIDNIKSRLHAAIVTALNRLDKDKQDVMQTLRAGLQLALGTQDDDGFNEAAIQNRIAELQSVMMDLVELSSKSSASADYFDAKFEEISGEIKALQDRLGEHNQQIRTSQNTHARISELLTTMEQLDLSVKDYRDDAAKPSLTK